MICLSACLHARLPACLAVYLSVCLSTCLPACLHGGMPVWLAGCGTGLAAPLRPPQAHLLLNDYLLLASYSSLLLLTPHSLPLTPYN
jgi:hypothetical protein